jgi:hypothetical protein
MRKRLLLPIVILGPVLMVPGAAVKARASEGPATPVSAPDAVVMLDRTLEGATGLISGRYQKLTYRNAEWYGSTFFTGPDWTRVGRDWHHPGNETPSVRRFTVPRAGRITVSGRVFKLHQQGDGIRAIIRHNDREVWQGEIEGADGQGVEPNVALEVAQGDAIRFIVHKRGQITCDTTGWDPVIIYADGTQHRASEAFDKHEQGMGGWWYEVEADRVSDPVLPRVHALASDLSLVERVVRLGQPVELTEGDALPVFVVSKGGPKGTSEGGLVVAMPSGPAWTLRAVLEANDRLRVTVSLHGASSGRPALWSETYAGPWVQGWRAIDERLDQSSELAGLRRHVDERFAAERLALALWTMIQADWRRQDQIDDTPERYVAAAEEQMEKARALLADLRLGQGEALLADELGQLDRLAKEVPAADATLEAARRYWLAVRRLKRRIALANPLLDSGPMLVCKRKPPSWSHLVGQYFGWRQRPGGGLFLVENPGYSLVCRDIVGDQLPPGNFLEPCLSYDGRRIVFSYVACPDEIPDPGEFPVNEQWGEERYLHVYEIHVDGTGLRQLTDGRYDDLMPAYLPDGSIVFTSTRRRSYARCFGPEYSDRWDCYTIHQMEADGGNLRPLSANDVNEWFPTVSHRGTLLFARWDYIDRDAVTHQTLWSMRPDGANPIAVWGNATPKPHCTFQAKSIPGSGKIVFVASAHHSITAGPVCVVDPTVDVNSHAAITRVTPGPFPEAESSQIPEYYESPWPLSEEYFLVAYSADRLRFQGEHPSNPNPDNALGIYLLDTAGNRELLYRDPQISSTNPTPLVARPVPPVLSSGSLARETAGASAAENPTGEIVIADVYQGLGETPRGTIKSLRIVQVFPKTTPLANNPAIGLAGEENGRAILGTVPVEPDGSARFLVPAHKPIFFQVLDEEGFAFQTMRSSTYLQPGERISCVGCHEPRMSSPPAGARLPMALGRPPSPIEPGRFGGRPFSFVEVVQPVLDKQCVRCHGGEKTDGGVDLTGTPHQGFTKSYWALCQGPNEWQKMVGQPELVAESLVPRYYQRNQIQVTPLGGKYGALGSRLIKLLRDGHEDVQLDADELERLATWIDLNAIFYGVYLPEDQARQLAGQQVPMPEIE